MENCRNASHAGTWYSSDKEELDQQLSEWIRNANVSEPTCKAIIGPHAGFRYSGSTAAWAYCHINPDLYSRIFLFGPSHHFYLTGCALPYSSTYSTPLGPLELDLPILSSLSATNKFLTLSKSQEEAEHSLELHLPYIKKIFSAHDAKLIPILVGNFQNESEFGEIFAPFFADPSNLFIISSDFCHWGQRFHFTPHDKSLGAIHKSIEKMDREGMDLIENHDLTGFKSYLDRTRNTICGRNPIILLLSTILCSGGNVQTRFVRYSQSEQVKTAESSSVSYAACVSSVINSDIIV